MARWGRTGGITRRLSATSVTRNKPGGQAPGLVPVLRREAPPPLVGVKGFAEQNLEPGGLCPPGFVKIRGPRRAMARWGRTGGITRRLSATSATRSRPEGECPAWCRFSGAKRRCLSRRPCRVCAGRHESNLIRFWPRRVRGRKHCLPCKSGVCVPMAHKPCARRGVN